MKAFLLKLWLRAIHIDDEHVQSEWGLDLMILSIFVGNAIVHGYFIPGLIVEMESEPKTLAPLIYVGLMTTLTGVASLAMLWHGVLKFCHRKPWQPRRRLPELQELGW